MKNIQNQFGTILLFVMLFVTSASAIGTSSPVWLSPAQKQMMYKDIPQGNPDINTLVAEYRQVMETALKTSGGDMQKVVDALNAYTKQKYPANKLLTLDDVNNDWLDHGFASEEKSASIYLSILQKNNKLTKGEADFFIAIRC